MTKILKTEKTDKKKKAWVVTVDMGYGHQRATYPLKHLAYDEIINSNSHSKLNKNDRKIWKQSRESYEFMARFKRIPVIGSAAWKIFDSFQKIMPFYPKRDLSKPSFQLRATMNLIRKKNWGKDLIDYFKKKNLPMISSFFIPLYMAEWNKYQNDLYCIVCDADISRAWAPYQPTMSKIKYFAPTERVVNRLKLYGVNPNNIYLTGFPLPMENIGYNDSEIVRKDIGERLVNLDPNKKYMKRYKKTVVKHLGEENFLEKSMRPLSLMFAVGGAGAQRELGITIVKSLKQKIKNKEIELYLVAGVHNDVASFFKKELRSLGLHNEIGSAIKIIVSNTKNDYFEKFNKALRKTDILWTKPSELSFYSALGVPIVMSTPIGSQEFFNQEWLTKIGAGIDQYNPKYCSEWLFDWINSGWLAEAVMHGFLGAPRMGTVEIEKILNAKK